MKTRRPSSQTAIPKNQLEAVCLQNLKLIKEATEELKTKSSAETSLHLLELLEDTAGASNWLRISRQTYPYSAKLYENQRWFSTQRALYPPGTTFLGIVLKGSLEVSVVERLNTAGVEYHRPMAILHCGSIFGTFEATDILCQSTPLQNYTVYSGIRTFFFEDGQLDCLKPGKGPIVDVLECKLSRQRQRLTDMKRWAQYDENYSRSKSSPTEAPLHLMRAVLGDEISQWRSEVLLIDIGSQFVADVSAQVRKLIHENAWLQSASLRRQAIQAYVSDSVVPLLKSAHIPDTIALATARELAALPDVVREERPGFLKFDVPSGQTGAQQQSDAIGINDIGPFVKFFENLDSLAANNYKRAVYAAGNRFDAASPFIYPLWCNADPLNDHPGDLGEQRGPGSLRPITKEENSSKIFGAIFSDDISYTSGLVNFLEIPEKAEASDKVLRKKNKAWQGSTPFFLRGAVEIQSCSPKLPLLDDLTVIPSWTAKPAAALIAVQHIMEETLCLIDSLVNRKVVARNQDVWLLGKPYSYNKRVAHRMRLCGVNIEPRAIGWELGRFDEWFDPLVQQFLREKIEKVRLSGADQSRPIVLLDDGGSLLRAAAALKGLWPGGFVGVEQTSRGIIAALGLKFPVVLVACSALKSAIEPEFVARAAVSKIARYYPEALRRRTVGVVGLGSVGKYFAQYLIARSDIDKATNVLGASDEYANDVDTPRFRFIRSKDELFAEADVVFGCTGNDLGDFALRSKRRGQLLISLSSGDIEFASALRRASRRPGAKLWEPIRINTSLVAHSGLPITFDGTAVSAPLIEMQLTRALLLTAVIQVLSEKKVGPIPLDPSRQWEIWEAWKTHVLNGDAAKAWRAARDAEISTTDSQEGRLAAKLKEVAVGEQSDLANRNEKLFNLALKRAKGTIQTSSTQGRPR